MLKKPVDIHEYLKAAGAPLAFFYQSLINRKMEDGDQITHIYPTGEMRPLQSDVERATGYLHKGPDL